ncbi:transposase [Spongiibacter sp. KMU-166]|uniref:Transposase n=1 Tax=Spongiibacter thalassae TaxID=2721624 RepID=A0ABX1GF21_9GAMM|nr:transposase [Spongiibacter thalassae]
MDTQGLLPPPVKPRRRRHSLEFKTQVLAACAEPGASIAAVAQHFNVNANLIHKWRRATEATRPPKNGDFVKVALPRPTASTSPQALKLELTCTHGPVVIHWPLDQLDLLSNWLRSS